MEKWQRRFRKLLVDYLELPADIILKLPKITAIGNIHVYIENYQELTYFSESELKLKTENGFIKITGASLILKTMLPREILLEGTIFDVKFIYK